MREETILQMNKNRANNEALLYRQFEFLETRMRAFELALATHPFIAVLRPKAFKRIVNELHRAYLIEADEKMAESVKRIKEEKAKPKLTLIGANGLVAVVLACLFFSGCVSKRQYAHDMAGVQNQLIDCRYESSIKDREIAAKTKRLAQFNQVDEKGVLRPLITAKGTSEGWDTDGTDSWLK